MRYSLKWSLRRFGRVVGDSDRGTIEANVLYHSLPGLARLGALCSKLALPGGVCDGFSGGVSVEETTEILQISPQSVMRDWEFAKAWLVPELG
jgi:hypothetical protein